ncbi:MAG: P-II family nitrogen regulator [Wenzhouxiangellaceae bacterium]|nr:P-II family nitrogen regulator [Wenzhouxiangellaceae bacterium]
MHFKLIVAFVEDERTEKLMDTARQAGATGATVVNQARGEGLKKSKTFFGLSLDTQRDMIMFLVEEHLARKVMEAINAEAEMDAKSGTGLAFQLDVEDVVGISRQAEYLTETVEENL